MLSFSLRDFSRKNRADFKIRYFIFKLEIGTLKKDIDLVTTSIVESKFPFIIFYPNNDHGSEIRRAGGKGGMEIAFAIEGKKF